MFPSVLFVIGRLRGRLIHAFDDPMPHRGYLAFESYVGNRCNVATSILAEKDGQAAHVLEFAHFQRIVYSTPVTHCGGICNEFQFLSRHQLVAVTKIDVIAIYEPERESKTDKKRSGESKNTTKKYNYKTHKLRKYALFHLSLVRVPA